MSKATALFLCTRNSARSQMAEGWLRHLAGDRFDAVSAGTNPSALNPLAVASMQEAGVNISQHHAKSIDEFGTKHFDYVITVCDRAKESCPYFPAAMQVFHWTFEDPAEARGTEKERLAVFRRVRDEIREKIENDFICFCKGRED